MIANLTFAKNCIPLIDYNEKKVTQGKAERISCNVFDDLNLHPNHIKKIINSESAFSKRKDKNVHISLNFLKEDFSKLDQKTLLQIANEYLMAIGVPPEHNKIIYQHFDTQHPHIHIVCSKFSDGQFLKETDNFYKSQSATRMLEQKFNLTKVNSRKQKDFVKKEDLEKSVDEDRTNLTTTQKISYSIQSIIKNKNPINLNQFRILLKDEGINLIEIDGKNRVGEDYKGLAFNLLEEPTQIIKASNLYNKPTAANLQKLFLKNKKYDLQNQQRILRQIQYILKKYESITYEKFEEELAVNKVFVQYIQKGGIKAGWSFYDDSIKLKYKASDIDRKLSFGNMKNNFSTNNIKNSKFRNENLFKYQLREYAKVSKESFQNNPQQFVEFMLKKGFKPLFKNNQIYFNHISNKSPKEEDFIGGYIIPISNNLNFSKISAISNHKGYNNMVYSSYNMEKSDSTKSNKQTETSQTSHFERLIDAILMKFIHLFDNQLNEAKKKKNLKI